MSYRRTRRYPEINPNITMDELSRKWSELIRELNNRDVEPVPPADIYGRNYAVEPVFVTAGTSIPNPPGPGYWHRYSFEIPADAGLVLVEPVSVSSTASVQIVNTLPPAQFSEGRTITVAFNTISTVSGYNAFNLAVNANASAGDVIVPLAENTVTIQNTVSVGGTIQVSTFFVDVSGNDVPSGTNLLTVAFNGGTAYPLIAITSTGSSQSQFYSTRLHSEAFGNINVSVQSNATYNPLNYTFRAFGNKWVQIA